MKLEISTAWAPTDGLIDVGPAVKIAMLTSTLPTTIWLPVSCMPLIEADVIEQRKFPYIYPQPAWSVNHVHTDEFGNITSIAFLAGEEVVKKKTLTIIITWDSMTRVKEWLDTSGSKPKVVKREVTTHNRGVVPVIAG